MKTLNTKAKWMKAFILLPILTAGISMLPSCSDNDDPKTEPEPDTNYTLKYNSMNIIELKQIAPGNKVQDIATTDAEKYFGKRPRLALPNELVFKEDSLYINKSGDVNEGYKMKWEGKKLLLHNEQSDQWEYCGEQKEKQFVLNHAFYIKRSKENTRRALTVMGQAYALENYADIVDDETSTYWLKVNYTFE